MNERYQMQGKKLELRQKLKKATAIKKALRMYIIHCCDAKRQATLAEVEEVAYCAEALCNTMKDMETLEKQISILKKALEEEYGI